MIQNKETTAQSCRKILNKKTKKSPWIEGALFNCTGEIGLDNFDCMHGSLFFFFFFCDRPTKKNMANVRLLLNFPLSL